MGDDFVNFIVMYFILVMMFSIIANINYMFVCPEYSTLFGSLMIILDSSMGNYDFSIFEQIEDSNVVENAYLNQISLILMCLYQACVLKGHQGK